MAYKQRHIQLFEYSINAVSWKLITTLEQHVNEVMIRFLDELVKLRFSIITKYSILHLFSI